jgi:2-hydroxyisobutanoyl-CoA mutase large subunit
MRLRFHCQTAAASLTAPQYMNNIMRTTLQGLAAVLGGCQSLHTNGYDEAFAIPTEHAMKLALRTQQIIAEESHVADVIDPLGGSTTSSRSPPNTRSASSPSSTRSTSAAAPSS